MRFSFQRALTYGSSGEAGQLVRTLREGKPRHGSRRGFWEISERGGCGAGKVPQHPPPLSPRSVGEASRRAPPRRRSRHPNPPSSATQHPSRPGAGHLGKYL